MLSVGCSGSWFWICATNNCRKVCSFAIPSTGFCDVDVGEVPVDDVLVESVDLAAASAAAATEWLTSFVICIKLLYPVRVLLFLTLMIALGEIAAGLVLRALLQLLRHLIGRRLSSRRG